MSTFPETYLSVVVPLQSGAAAPDLPGYIDQVFTLFSSRFEHIELLLIDDHGEFHERASVLLQQYPCLRYVQLTRPQPIEIAITAGFDLAIGDIVVVLPLGTGLGEYLDTMIENALARDVLVIGDTTSPPRPRLHRLCRTVFFWTARRLLNFDLCHTGGHVMALSRSTLNTIGSVKDKLRYVKAIASVSGARVELVRPTEPVLE
ncbi:MAG: hypothetical protein KDD44_01860, partial [Bdellovibrionales bacterium]|nr:hypothetical protein [Bdellovibrionales bacterium]